jgi:hypothetical protein
MLISGFGVESLAAHISPGHAVVLGFFMPGADHLPTTFLDMRNFRDSVISHRFATFIGAQVLLGDSR